MEENLRELSKHLREASTLLSTVLDDGHSTSVDGINANNQPTAASSSRSTTNTASTSQQTSVRSGIGLSTAIGSRIGSAVARARSMITSSASRGAYSRLGQRERLRAASTPATNQPTNKRQKKEAVPVKKAFEFVLVNVTNENESWAITDETVVLRGLIEITTQSNEAEIRAEIGNATRTKYPMVSDSDFEFLRATRRKLSKPVSCQSYDYQQVKLLSGQGSIYLKLKDGLDCLFIDDDDNSDDQDLMPPPPFTPPNSSPTTTGVEVTNPPQLSSISNEPPNTEEIQISIQSLATSNESNQPLEISGERIDNLIQSSFEKVISDCIKKCITENISDPIEILRCAQKYIVQGRPLDIISSTDTVEGETNFIHVDRQGVLKSAFEEINLLENPRLTLEVSFYGELASDLGGPRKEFFMLCLREIQSKYFDQGLRDYMSTDYEAVGLIMGLSMLQNGCIPHFLTEEMIQELFTSETPSQCIANLRAGFAKVGLIQIGREIPVFLNLLRQSSTGILSRKKLICLLKPSFSEEGSNSRQYENTAYRAFSNYVRGVASARRDGLTLGNILQFCTGTDKEPVLGFVVPPSIQFFTATSSSKWAFIPFANTCSQVMKLPTSSHGISLPTEDELFEVYDYAFCNSYFGLA